MKKILTFILSIVLVLLVSGCDDTGDKNLQKISDLRHELNEQIKEVKNAGYKVVTLSDDFVAKIPDSDILYDLTLTAETFDFQQFYDKFDKIFDKEFGDIYTQEDKDALYRVLYEGENGENYLEDTVLLKNRIDKLKSGEQKLGQIYVDTDKAYLTLFLFGTGVYGLSHDDLLKQAGVTDYISVSMYDPTNFFDVVKNYLDVDSEDRYALLDREVSVRELAEKAKEMTAEYNYSWGGDLEPEVYQVRIIDIGGGKYGFDFTFTPSYKGVIFDSYEFTDSAGQSMYGEKTLSHDYDLFMPQAFMMEYGQFERFHGGYSGYTAKETASHDRVISFADAVKILEDELASQMELSVSRAELMYTGMYPASEDDKDENSENSGETVDRSVEKAFPVWKFRCHNTNDDLKYIIYVNAINGKVEYYVCDWWEVRN